MKPKITSNIVVFILFYLLTFTSTAQDRIISFRHLSSNDGLANNNVNCFTQDQWGYIWVGTSNGLSCFDSYSFKNFSTTRNGRKGLVSSNVQTLLCDSSNNIWIGTAAGGLSVLDRQDGTMYAYHLLTHNARFNDVKALFQLPTGEILVGTNIGLYIAKGDIKNLHFSAISYYLTYDSQNPLQRINSFAQDSQNRIWIGCESGSLFMLNTEGQNKYKITEFTRSQKENGRTNLAGIQSLCITKNDMLWYATWGQGIQYADISSGNISKLELSISKSKTFDRIAQVTIGTDITVFNNTIYATTWNQGIVSYNIETDSVNHWKNTQVRHPGLITNDLFSVFADKDGNIWIGASRFGGISIYTWKAQMVEHYELSEIVTSKSDRNRVYSLEGDKSGNIFIGGVGGMFQFQNNNLKFQNIPFPLNEKEQENLKILSVEYDPFRKQVWAGSDGLGLFNYDLNTKKFNRFEFNIGDENGPSNNSIHEIYMGVDGIIWIGSWGGGLDSYNPEKGIFKNHKLDTDESTNNVVLDIAADKYGSLWLATMGKGLIRFNKSESKMYHQMITDQFGNIPQNFYFVYHDKHEDIWAACLENGLVHYNPRTKETEWFNASHSMEFGHISGIESASDTTMFINTDKGVFILTADGIIKDNYKFTDNLTPMTFWNESSMSDQSNWIYLASDKGLLRYNPKFLKKDTISPIAQITKIQLFDSTIIPGVYYDKNLILTKPIENTTEINLGHNQNSLSFTFSAMDFTNSRNNRYSYKLEGFDNKWRTAKATDRKVTYTNIPTGTYEFKVKATNSDGIWSKKYRKLAISINPPFWHSLWFYFLLSLLFILTTSSYIKLRQKQLAIKNKKLKTEVIKRTREVISKNNELSASNKELHKQTELLNISNEQIKRQKELLEYQHKEINKSISYARNLQESLLPSPRTLRELFPDSFVLFRPKDAISGDFYWSFSNEKYSIILAADCTGHGIPGAMVSMLGLSFFNTIASVSAINNAGDVINNIAKLFNKTFCNTASTRNAKDSMDLSVCVFNKTNKEITFSGILNPLFLIRNNALQIYPASRKPLSCENKDTIYGFHIVEYKEGDALYLFSDGFQDQFGGPQGKKFKTKNFKHLLCSIADKSMLEQKRHITETFAGWLFHGNSNRQNEQTDDVLVIGIRISNEIFEN